MAVFNTYVELPEGRSQMFKYHWKHIRWLMVEKPSKKGYRRDNIVNINREKWVMNQQSLRLVLGINESQYQLDGEYPNNNNDQ